MITDTCLLPDSGGGFGPLQALIRTLKALNRKLKALNRKLKALNRKLKALIRKAAPLCFFPLILFGVASMADDQSLNSDEYLWLEDVLGDQALTWVEARNQLTVDKYTKSESFSELSIRLKAIMDSDDRIPYVSKLGNFYYNFWQDAENPKGVLRRTSLDEYRKQDPKWETVLDIDKLSVEEGENWVYKGTDTLLDHDRTLVELSRGGSDAAVVREFDLSRKAFVKDGFNLPEAKSGVAWLSLNEVLVATEFGDGSLTDSGYPRIVKLWTRGELLENANTVYEGQKTDVSVSGFSDLTKGYEVHGITRGMDFYNSDLYLRHSDGKLAKMDKPSDADLAFHRDWVFIETRTDWQVGDRSYPGNSLLSIDRKNYLAGGCDFEVLFEPTDGKSLAGFSITKNHVLVIVLHNVQNEIYSLSKTAVGWTRKRLDNGEQFRTVSISPVDERADDRYWSTSHDFMTPPTLSIGEVGKDGDEVLKQSPHMFDSSNLEVSQHWVDSADGTLVPYFLVGQKNTKGPQPALLYGYGGFEISLLPQYMAVGGAAWMERGGIYVIANIRGGGEFGPGWHHAALKENRPRAYEDFIAVAQDLIKRGITTKSQLGAAGGSNGGLLMGNMLTMRPDLFGALAIAVPLIDMYRYHKLLAGASWMAEYGDPDDPEQWEFIQKFSPYHNLVDDIEYPHILVTTSTRDDRAHPGHARKLVAKLTGLGHEVWYYENTEGGHAGAADNSQRAFMNALEYEFLWDVLGNPR